MANPNEQAAQSPKTSKVIIAVNMPDGVGYFVDSEGNELFNKQFEGVRKFTEGLAGVKQDDKWGYINTKGDVVIPCIYDDAWGFSKGLAQVQQNGKKGLINAKGEVVVPCVHKKMRPRFVRKSGGGFAFVQQDDKWGIINKVGKVIVSECDKQTTTSSIVEME